ncbi:hypothetical protein J3459_014238 [Metarhizium acridum]|nr:hypothetical protein J3459_014238 [Metarhizium acridum]
MVPDFSHEASPSIEWDVASSSTAWFDRGVTPQRTHWRPQSHTSQQPHRLNVQAATLFDGGAIWFLAQIIVGAAPRRCVWMWAGRVGHQRAPDSIMTGPRVHWKH